MIDYIGKVETVLRKSVDMLGDPKKTVPLPPSPPLPSPSPPTVYIDEPSGTMATACTTLNNSRQHSTAEWQRNATRVAALIEETQTAAEETFEIIRNNHIDPLNHALRAAERETTKLVYYSPAAPSIEPKLSIHVERKLATLLADKMSWVQNLIFFLAWLAGVRGAEFPEPPQPRYPLTPPGEEMNRHPGPLVT